MAWTDLSMSPLNLNLVGEIIRIAQYNEGKVLIETDTTRITISIASDRLRIFSIVSKEDVMIV